MMASLPQAARPLVEFVPLLRGAGFSISTDQTIDFLEAVRLVGPRSIDAVRHAAYACLAPRLSQRDDFEVLFRAHFHGEVMPLAETADDDELCAEDEGDPEIHPDESSPGESGSAACSDELLFMRGFDPAATQTALHDLPLRRTRRRRPCRKGRLIDLGRSLSQMVRNDGDIPVPAMRERRTAQRRMLLLIDISGSMKQHTADHLRLAHALVRSGAPVEIFTLGTRLTRITRALSHRLEEVTLARVAEQVADWDGGTRLGPVLSTLLREPRHANFARGAAVLILSDGLERGDPAELVTAVRRLARSAWRLSWATPLAADPRFQPETAALRAMLPLLDDLVDGGSMAALTRFIARLKAPAEPALRHWAKRKLAS